MQPNNSELEYKSKDGVIFKIRSNATRRDQSDLTISQGEYTTVRGGKKIHVNAMAMFPWLFERFVIGWRRRFGKNWT